MSLLDVLKGLKIHPYIYIEPCPRCKSKVTGRYIKEPMTESDMEYTESQSLKHGEIIRFIPKVPEKNAFCVDCDYRWHYTPRTIYISKLEMEQMIEERNTEDAYYELRNEISNKNLVNSKRKKGLF